METTTQQATKYIVKQVEKQEGEKAKFHFIGTAGIYPNGQGYLMTQAYGALRLYRKDERSKNGSTVYAVKKTKETRDGKAVHNEVGTFLVRDGGKTGALFLHLLDAEFAVFKQEEKAALEVSAQA